MEKTELPGPRTAKIETVTDRELSAIEGGLNGTPCRPGTFLTIGGQPRPGQPAPFRDVFAKYTIGPV